MSTPKIKTWADKAKYGFVLFLFTTFITSIVLLVTLLRSDILPDMTALSWIYFIPATVGHASLFALALYLIYLLLITITRSFKFSVTIYIIVAILLQIFIVLDGLVFNLYRFHINGFVLDLVFGAGSDVFVFEFWLYLKFILLAFLVAVIPYIIALWIARKTYNRFRRKLILISSASILICLVVAHIGHACASALRNISIERSATVMPYFFPLTANSLLAKFGIVTSDEIEGVSYNMSTSNLNYPLHPLEISDSIPHYNILHIVIDSWNPSTFDSIVTPHIYEFSKKSTSYSNHYSSHCATSGSIFGMFFGVPYAYDKDFQITQRTPVFIDQIVDNGYVVQTFPSATFEKPPFHKRIFRRTPDINTKTQGKTPFERDNKITEMALDFLKERKEGKPFYAFMFYDLPHAISIPKEYHKFQPSWDEPDYLKLSNDLDRTPFFNLYKNCMYHVDKLVGDILAYVETGELLDNTIVVITADHGQEFNENKKNYWGHSSNFTDWQLKVPFILYDPKREGGNTISHMTTHYDITPTLMSRYLGVKNPMIDYSIGYEMDSPDSRYPLLVGDNTAFGFVFENIIVNTNEIGATKMTDRNLKPIDRKELKASELRKAIDRKNHFYK